MPFSRMLEGLFRDFLEDFLIAIIAVSGINVIEITTTLAALLGPHGLSLDRESRTTLGTVS
jgi:small-conductance mechanosensitive channel